MMQKSQFTLKWSPYPPTHTHRFKNINYKRRKNHFFNVYAAFVLQLFKNYLIMSRLLFLQEKHFLSYSCGWEILLTIKNYSIILNIRNMNLEILFTLFNLLNTWYKLHKKCLYAISASMYTFSENSFLNILLQTFFVPNKFGLLYSVVQLEFDSRWFLIINS